MPFEILQNKKYSSNTTPSSIGSPAKKRPHSRFPRRLLRQVRGLAYSGAGSSVFCAIQIQMTRRSINLLQYWLTIGLFFVPSVAFILAGYVRFESGYFAKADFDPYAFIILTVLGTLLWAFVCDHLGVKKLSMLLTFCTGFVPTTKATG